MARAARAPASRDRTGRRRRTGASMSAQLFPELEAPVAACLFYGLAPASPDALDPAAWTASAVEKIVEFRLTSHALALIEDHGVVIADALREQLDHGLLGQTINAMRLEGVACELQQFLQEAGIASVALKGVALGDVQIDRCPRFYGDVDL